MSTSDVDTIWTYLSDEQRRFLLRGLEQGERYRWVASREASALARRRPPLLLRCPGTGHYRFTEVGLVVVRHGAAS